MSYTVSPTVDDVFTALRAWVLTIVPAGTIVLRGPVDRAAQPTVDHIVLTPLSRDRLRTNEYTDDTVNQTVAIEQGTKLEIQCDFYGDTLAADWAAMFTTLFRDPIAVQALAPTCAPLYADEGPQVPLVTGEEQYLERWIVRAVLQYNPVTTTPQQSATTLTVAVKNVDEAYPP